MLRITPVVRKEGETLKLEGSLAGPWVGELARVAEESLARAPRLELNLSAVTFVDAEGTRLLRELMARGAAIRSCSRFVAELMEQQS